ncbi:RHS repeat-associated core domain-containing protein [Pseudomonas azerbaijanoccidens]|uniref:RHS repeat-associated core domain-containing protein n=1 Tax=Pseudomonas azerbaijanoccidentalis TaxID=2842347 RepID=UPI00200A0930|nr:RHS repeat-associated core domain-containing protein [Pseudomonas azerbaijanoccidentalis]MCK8665775.1 RHS repeat-associated core domain-containing protein [Pseudomonas azerbaijanoccidentalis]
MTIQRDTLLCQYRYDPQDKIVGCDLLNQESIQRFYRKDRLATEIQGPVLYSILEHEDQPLAQQLSQEGRVDSLLLATDFKRSVLHSLIKGEHQPSVFCPYGHRSPESGLSSLLGFNGQRRDPVTGHYLLGNGYRAFNPVLMRFNSPDSLSPFGKGGVNAYAYCMGDPVNKMDPTGGIALIAPGLSRLVYAPISTFRQIGKGLSAMKKSAMSRPHSASTSEVPKRTPRPSPLNALIDEAADEVKLRQIGKEYKAIKTADEPPAIARFAKSKNYSEQDLFAEDGFKNDPGVQKQYFHSQQPEAIERLRQADVKLLVATGVHVRKYPAHEVATRELISRIRWE